MKSTERKTPPGFALVATLMMMMLLAVIAVGLLGLSSIELRKTGNGSAMERARANARMALMIALGELQENLGPDQRVSADARVAYEGSTDPEHPHWVSVWKTTQEDGQPWITRDAEKGGLSDARQAGGWNARDERMTTLVSGNETGMLYQDDGSGGTGELVPLVDKGSLGPDAEDEDFVSAPRVEVTNSPTAKGGYAWWVGDLGAQANVATRDATPDTAIGEYHALMLAQDSSWKAYRDKGGSPGNKELENEERAKLVSEGQLALVQPDMGNRRFHDFTVWSAGLPTNIREGGWRKDLTAYMAGNGAVGDHNGGSFILPGMKDLDNVINTNVVSGSSGSGKRQDPVSPKFGLLRKWAERAKGAPMGSYSVTAESPEVVSKSTGGYNDKSVDFDNRTNAHLMPVLVEGSLYYNLSYYEVAPAPNAPAARAPFGLRLHLYPRVALWNPYNFSIRVPVSTMFMHINGAKQIEVTMEGNIKRSYRMFWGLNNNKSETGGATRGSMFFKMDAATLGPGETLVWSPSKNGTYNETESFGANTLTSSLAPAANRAFYMDKRLDGVDLFEALDAAGDNENSPRHARSNGARSSRHGPREMCRTARTSTPRRTTTSCHGSRVGGPPSEGSREMPWGVSFPVPINMVTRMRCRSNGTLLAPCHSPKARPPTPSSARYRTNAPAMASACAGPRKRGRTSSDPEASTTPGISKTPRSATGTCALPGPSEIRSTT
jgi:hypothetical protein